MAKMLWNKKGIIFTPDQQNISWMVSHAAVPFAEHIEGDRYRIYCSIRNHENKAHGGFIDISLSDLNTPLHISEQPIIAPGLLGCFDDAGTMPSCIVNHNGKKYLYYVGWSRAADIGFTVYIGLAISEDGGQTFQRYSLAPILGRTYYDPYLTASPWVTIENGLWKIWYVSGVGWERRPGLASPRHYYHIKYAQSFDGINWDAKGTVCIDFNKDGMYTMWYSYRGGTNTYRIGYAESLDGLRWTRKDHLVGLQTSSEGWDSEMVCYSYVFEHQGTTYMLYNGNGYGKTGFGYAVLEKS